MVAGGGGGGGGGEGGENWLAKKESGGGRHACLPRACLFFLAPKYFYKKAPATQATSVSAENSRCFGVVCGVWL